MRIFFSILLAAGIVFAPSITWAQNTSPATPPPETTGGPPNVAPPTKAPTMPLPPTPLMEEAIASTTSGAGKPIMESSSVDKVSSTDSSLPLIAFTVGAILLIIGVGWYLWRRKEGAM